MCGVDDTKVHVLTVQKGLVQCIALGFHWSQKDNAIYVVKTCIESPLVS